MEEIRHRLQLRGPAWSKLAEKILQTRQSQALLFQLPSIDQVFWYFEADCIRQKLSEVERLGTKLYDGIHNSKTFEKDFILDAAVEEAITSAIYEGANTTRAQARQFMAEKRSPANKAEQMLANNYAALEWLRNHLEQEVSRDLILKVHAIVTQNTMEGDDVHYSGKFRDDVVFVGPHEGVKHGKIEKAIDEAIQETTKNERFIHPLIRGILLHYLIAYIHPFFDGNGRTARTMFYFKAMRNGLNFVELLKEYGKRYERSFENAVEHEGDMTYFVDFALDSLLAALTLVEEKVTYLQKLWKLAEKYGLTEHQILLLQRLALNKFRRMGIEEYAETTQRSHEMARLELKSLLKLEFLQESKLGRKLYYTVNAKLLKQRVSEVT
jgi:Fic family protein